VQVDFQDREEMLLSHNFQNYINKRLTGKFEDDPDVYYDFIRTFGTHYFESALFGGYLHQRTTIKNNYLRTMESQQIKAHLEVKFLWFVTASADYNSTKTKIDENIEANSENDFYYYGGITDLFNRNESDRLKKWSDTIHRDPWLFGGQLMPVSNLISNATIRAEVKKAVSFVFAKAFLHDFKSIVSLTHYQLSTEDRNLLGKIEYDLNNPKPDADVTKADKEIETMLRKVKQGKVATW